MNARREPGGVWRYSITVGAPLDFPHFSKIKTCISPEPPPPSPPLPTAHWSKAWSRPASSSASPSPLNPALWNYHWLMQFSTWLQTRARSRYWTVYPHFWCPSQRSYTELAFLITLRNRNWSLYGKLPIRFLRRKKSRSLKGKAYVPTTDHSTEYQILEHFQINFG